MKSSVTTLLALAASLTLLTTTTTAQTFTLCNPLNRTDCPSNPALGTNHTFTFSSAPPAWNVSTSSVPDYRPLGAAFTVQNRGDAPTLQSQFYLFFGVVEVIMKAATGQGIISSIVLESDDLDEIDWELMGGNTTHVETNYFGKGNTTSYDRAVYYRVERPQELFHNYTLLWTREKVEWFVDGASIRVLKYAEANAGRTFPQTPMNVRIGIWAGGDKALPKDTVDWAGGLTDYAKGPYSMVVKSARVTDFGGGKEYSYGDKSGKWESIKVVNGTSDLANIINAPPTPTLAQRWANLSSTAKAAIGASIGGFCAIMIALLAFCCVRQRRIGRRERAIEDSKFENGRAELMAYRAEMDGFKAQREQYGKF